LVFDLIATIIKLAVFIGLFLGLVSPIMVWVERKAAGLFQDRPGPNRLGPFGLFQPLADALKFFFKEDVTPALADKPLYLMAPALAVLPALTTFVFIPFGPTGADSPLVAGRAVPLIVADASAGVLLFLAIASLGVYSLVLAGYGSNNKYALLGGLRASAQLISYELAMTLAVVAVLIPVASFHLGDVVAYQQRLWNIVPQALGFLVFMVAAFAETNRLPFDLPEAESELVAGFHTEYSAMRFASFFMSEYVTMTTLSALAATLYLGGWSLFGLPEWAAAQMSGLVGPFWLWMGLFGLAVLMTKVAFFMFFYVWVRWTFLRFRYDQLMRLGWKVLLPLALVNVIWVAAATLAGWL
jgi:NADH-quinone oxidoreductase subunit H